MGSHSIFLILIMLKSVVFTLFCFSTIQAKPSNCKFGQYFKPQNCDVMKSERDCLDLDSTQNDIEWISGNFKCQELSKDWSCVCARVGNSHTFELYKKNGDGIFEKVTEENDNNLMVLARGPGMFNLARLPAKKSKKPIQPCHYGNFNNPDGIGPCE